MVKAQYPAPITDFQIKFWRYTLADLARIGLPAFLGLVLAGIPGAAIGTVLGFVASELRLHDKTLDQICIDFVRFQFEKSQVETEIEEVEETVSTTDGTVIGIVELGSVDLDMASERDWQVNRDTLASLYKEIEEPVEIHSRKRQIDLSNYQCIPDSAVTTDHYIIVREFPGELEHEQRTEKIVDRCHGIKNSLNAGDLSATHLTDSQLKEAVQRLQLSDISVDSTGYKVGENQFRRLLTISEYPEERGLGLLSDVLNLETQGFIDVVQTIKPVTDKERRKLSRLIGRMKAESLATPNTLRNTEIDRKIADAEDLLDVEESGSERLVNAAAYIIIRGNSREQVDNTTEEVKRLLRRFSVEYVEPWLETPQTVQTDSPLHPDKLDKTMIMPSRSAASSFSFSTHDKFEENGISFGIDTRNGNPVILNRYNWEAGHIARMGKIGSGKSYFAKLSLYRSYHKIDSLQIHVIDPKQEYGGITSEIGGKTVLLDQTDLGETETGPVTRYTVTDRSKDNSSLLTQAVRHVYSTASEDTQPTIVLIDEAHRLLNNPQGTAALGELVREGRDRNISVEMITQNASDFTHSREGRDILKNVNCYIFMKHQDVETGVSNFFNLSNKETVELRRLRTGTDLPFSEAIIRGPVNTKLQVEALPQEHDIITKESQPPEMNQENHSNEKEETHQQTGNNESEKLLQEPSQTDGGTQIETVQNGNHRQQQKNSSNTVSSNRLSNHRKHRSSADIFMELPDDCLTEQEEPDINASPQELLPEILPGWKRLKTDKDRWKVPVAEDWINATYINPVGNRYMFHISKWAPEHVCYVIDELYGRGHPTRFDAWTARGRFIFAVKIAEGTVKQAKTLLSASPALSKDYLKQQ